MPDDETMLWRGSSSGVINFGVYFVCLIAVAVVGAGAVLLLNPLVLAALVAPAAFGFWKWLVNRCRVYEVTTQRLKVTTGILTKRTEELELYRVLDTSLVEPFLYRLFSAGNIVLQTIDQSSPQLVLEAIPRAKALRDELRKHIETCRDRKRVRVAEIDDDLHHH